MSSQESLRLLLLAAATASLAGCAGANRTLMLDVGPRYETYDERPDTGLDSALSQRYGSTVTATQGDASRIQTTGIGGQVGLTAQLKKWEFRNTAYYTHYSSVDYTFFVSGRGTIHETLKPSAFGVDGSLGYQLWLFRPHISYKIERMAIDVPATADFATGSNDFSQIDTTFYMGAGMTLDIPLGKRYRLAAIGDYRVPLNVSDAKVESVTVQFALRVKLGKSGP